MSMTTIKVEQAVRDRLKAAAVEDHAPTLGAMLERLLREHERALVLASVAEYQPTPEEQAERDEWLNADFGTVLG